MSLYLIGDIHADWPAAQNAVTTVAQAAPDGATLVCLGEMGYWPRHLTYGQHKVPVWPPEVTVPEHVNFLWIDGNHEDQYQMIKDGIYHGTTPCPCDTSEGGIVTYVPRGTVLEIDGAKILFMGGGDSVPWDKQHRNKKFQEAMRYFPKKAVHTWFQEETISEEQVNKAIANVEAVGGVDIILSHQPPARFDIPGITPLDPKEQPSRGWLNTLLMVLEPAHWWFADMHRVCSGETGKTKWRGLAISELLHVEV